MIFWNYRKLALALREGLVTPNQSLSYTIAFVLIVGGALSLYGWGLFHRPPAHTPNNMIYAYLLPAFCYAGWLILPYRINRAGDGKDFLKRFLCLNLPINLRYMAIFYPAIALLGIAESSVYLLRQCGHLIQPGSKDTTAFQACTHTIPAPSVTVLDTALYLFSILVFLYWFRMAFLYVSGKKTA